MDKNPLISIITVCYNSGKYLEECIQSVLMQDYPNIEHIIQDGASKDKTLKILKKYSSPRYKNRVKWISEPDNGQTDALNKALIRSKGEIILVLNADDVLLPSACTWGGNQLKKYKKAAVVYGDEYIIDERGTILTLYKPVPFNYEKLVCVEIVPPAQAAFIRRRFFEKVGFYFDNSLNNCADFELWVRLGLKYPIVYSQGTVSKFRWHRKSKTLNPEKIEDFVKEKRKVISDLFLKKTTPEKIKKIKKRASVGLDFWAASMQIDSGAKYGAIKYLVKAFLKNPSKKKLKHYIDYWFRAVEKREQMYANAK